MRVYRIRITPESGYYELCGLLVLAPPEGGRCRVYKHQRTDLPLEKAQEVERAMLARGEFDPEKWVFLWDYDASKIP